MEGEEERSEKEGSFSKASIPKRLAIVVAGATVNILFGLIVYFILMSSTGNYITNIVDSTMDSYIAQEIALQQGDKIIEIDGHKIKNQYDINTTLEKTEGKQVNVKIERQGEIKEYNIKPTEVQNKYTGIYLDENCKIITVDKDSPAEKQGIQANDKLLKINHEEINGDLEKVTQKIQEKGQVTILLTVVRGNQEINIEIKPETVSSYYLGVTLQQAKDTLINHLIHGGMETKEFAFSIVDNLKSLFTGKVGVDQMMGPVGISKVVANTNGFQEFIYMLALISLSLGVTNLLPVPALDGGKILILLIEAIRRKPLKQETEINIQLLGFSILIALSIYITYHDIMRIF